MHNFELWKVKGIFSVRLMAQAHTWTHKVKVYENLRFILLWYGFISPPLFCPGRMIQTSEHPRQDTITKFAGMSKLLLTCWHVGGEMYLSCIYIDRYLHSIYLHIYTHRLDISTVTWIPSPPRAGCRPPAWTGLRCRSSPSTGTRDPAGDRRAWQYSGASNEPSRSFHSAREKPLLWFA